MGQEELTPCYVRYLARLVRPFPNFDFFFIKPLRRRAVDALQLKHGSRALDVGCGPGGTFEQLIDAVGPWGQIVGIEISPEMATNAKRRIAANQWNNVEVIVGDARTVKLSGKFDGVVMFAAPDVYASPQALANLLPHLNNGAGVVLFGAKLSRHRLAGVLNVIFRGLMRLSFSSTPKLNYEPWCVLRDKGVLLEVKEYFFGCMFLAWGKVTAAEEIVGDISA